VSVLPVRLEITAHSSPTQSCLAQRVLTPLQRLKSALLALMAPIVEKAHLLQHRVKRGHTAVVANQFVNLVTQAISVLKDRRFRSHAAKELTAPKAREHALPALAATTVQSGRLHRLFVSLALTALKVNPCALCAQQALTVPKALKLLKLVIVAHTVILDKQRAQPALKDTFVCKAPQHQAFALADSTVLRMQEFVVAARQGITVQLSLRHNWGALRDLIARLRQQSAQRVQKVTFVQKNPQRLKSALVVSIVSVVQEPARCVRLDITVPKALACKLNALEAHTLHFLSKSHARHAMLATTAQRNLRHKLLAFGALTVQVVRLSALFVQQALIVSRDLRTLSSVLRALTLQKDQHRAHHVLRAITAHKRQDPLLCVRQDSSLQRAQKAVKLAEQGTFVSPVQPVKQSAQMGTIVPLRLVFARSVPRAAIALKARLNPLRVMRVTTALLEFMSARHAQRDIIAIWPLMHQSSV
jgi:hypothetical protein